MTPAQSVRQFIANNSLFHPGERVVIGISGGADSVALTYLLNDLKHELGITLSLAHFNHELRKGAKADENFVRDLARRLNLPLSCGSWPKGRSLKKGSLEDNARQARFAFLAKVGKATRSQKILLAHNQDDLAETVLLHLLRGSGLQGLQGILPERKIAGQLIVRPLLCLSRKEIEGYLKSKRISYCQDPTNRDRQFTRNKIRHHLLPVLKKNYNPNIKKLLANTATTIADDYQLLDSMVVKFFTSLAKIKSAKHVQFDLLKLKKEPATLQRLIIRKTFAYLKGNANQFTLDHLRQVEALIRSHPARASIHFPSSIKLFIDRHYLHFKTTH